MIGLSLGYWWGRSATLRNAQDRLGRFAEQIRARNARSAAEARQVLHQINALHLPPCSHEELTAFRHVIYGSEYLKDAGRIENGVLRCSAAFGVLKSSPADRLGAGFVRPDGTRAYRNLAPYSIPGQTVVAIRSGDGVVVYSPYNLRPFEGQPMRFSVTDRDINTGAARQLFGEAPSPRLRQRIFLRNGFARSDGMLYATRCNPQYSGCTTAYISVSDALSSQGQLRTYMGLSTLCGVLLSMLVFLLYKRNSSMEQQLRRAIRRDRLGVLYQPIIDLDTGRVIAAEALARWTDDDGISVSPDVFIRLAEDRGFVGEITRTVIHRAVDALKQTQEIQPEFSINVNISAADLNDPAFLPMVNGALASAGGPPRCLGFEITESSWTEWESARDKLVNLRERGHWVFIDDFGTGYSSLASLHNLPIDVLKIDKEFTHSIGTQSVKIDLVPQILSIASALKLKVIVEGIESEEQARYFADSRQQIMAQGWYFGRPMPLENLLILLRTCAISSNAGTLHNAAADNQGRAAC